MKERRGTKHKGMKEEISGFERTLRRPTLEDLKMTD